MYQIVEYLSQVNIPLIYINRAHCVNMKPLVVHALHLIIAICITFDRDMHYIV